MLALSQPLLLFTMYLRKGYLTNLQSPMYIREAQKREQQRGVLLGVADGLLQQVNPPRGNGHLSRFLHRLVTEFQYSAGEQFWRHELDRCKSECRDNNDNIGFATCRMLEGDFSISPGWTHVTLLDLAIVEGQSESAAFEKWDTAEAALNANPSSLEEAEAFYTEAYLKMKEAGAIGGMGAIRVRQGCMKHLEVFRQQTDRPSRLHAAMEFFNEAETLFQRCQDVRLLQFVEAHQLLVAIKQGVNHSIDPGAIGRWGRDSGDYDYVHSIGLMLLRYGWREWRRSSFDTALAAYQAALQLFVGVDAQLSQIMTKSSLRTLYYEVSQYEQAIKFGEDALQHLLNVTNNNPPATLLFDLKRLLLLPHYSLEHSERCAELAEDLQTIEAYDAKTKRRYKTWSDYLSYKLQYRKALHDDDFVLAAQIADDCRSYLATVATEDAPDLYFIRVCQINILAERGHYEQARSVIAEMEQDGQLGDKGVNTGIQPTVDSVKEYQGKQKSRYDFNICILAKDFQKAFKYYEKLKQADPTYFDTQTLHSVGGRRWQGSLDLGKMWEGLGKQLITVDDEEGLHNLKLALENYKISCDLAETHRQEIQDPDIRMRSFGRFDVVECFAGAARVSLQLYEHTGERDWIEQSLGFVERGKARSLLDSLSSWKPESIESLLPTTIFENPIERVSALLSNNTLVVNYSLTEEGLLVIPVSRNGAEFPRWIDVKSFQVEEMVASYLKHIEIKPGTRRSDESRELLQRSADYLSELILSPLREALLGKGNGAKDDLIFIPSGTLARFPFAALKLDEQPLFFNHSVGVCPSFTTLELLMKKSNQSSGETPPINDISVLISNKSLEVGPGGTPFTVLEANFLGQRFEQPPKAAEDLDEAAWKQQLENCHILHLCAHGTFKRNAPLESSIQFSRPLKVSQFVQLKLNASLVIFRACMSGLGRFTESDDMTGFAHAVLKSGARSFIGSLWKTADRSNFLLMILFYNVLLENNECSFSKALATAQRELYNTTTENLQPIIDTLLAEQTSKNIKPNFNCKRLLERTISEIEKYDWKDPFYWAPFILTGDGRVSTSFFSGYCKAKSPSLSSPC